MLLAHLTIIPTARETKIFEMLPWNKQGMRNIVYKFVLT